jgi:hypothetical protein
MNIVWKRRQLNGGRNFCGAQVREFSLVAIPPSRARSAAAFAL